VKKILTVLGVLFAWVQVFAQAPQKMSYQAVIRNSNQALITSTVIGMRISILQGTSNGMAVYAETQKPMANANGLVSVQIGMGTVVNGSFASIKWAEGPYFIKTETDPLGGTAYTVTGTSELMSVPYALFSANGSNGATGATGATGIQGVKGSQGLAGADGATGASGSKGEIGAVGATGNNGKIGETGATGLQGTIGNQGLTGPAGASGIIGLQGKTGANGTAGINGTNGGTGAIGLQGITGANGKDGATGMQGVMGLAGTNGTDGSRGETGAIGVTGTPGSAGVNGTNGLQGLTGATGAAGINGTNGIIGIQGLPGSNGAAGINGTNGTIGLQGLAGATGAAGINGTNGTIGIQGLPGSNGAAGINGTNGIKGDTGVTGSAGLTGAKGDIGLTGPAGSFTGSFSGDVTGTQNATVVAKINGTSLSALESGILKNTTVTGVPSIAVAGDFPVLNQNTSGTAANVTGIILPGKGGTGVANNNASTLTLSGAFATTVATTGITAITLPTTGTIYGTATGSITSAQLLNSLSDATGTGRSVFSVSPNFTELPLAPTATIGTNTTQLATTAFVLANSNSHSSVTAGNAITTVSTTDEVITGMTVTPPAGKYAVSFNSQYSITPSDRTGQSKIDLRAAYNQLMAKTVTNASHVPTYGGGETLTAGVYANAGACTVAGILILDAQNNPNAEFVFKFGAAFSTAANVTISLINGASACNVYWIAEGAIALGVATVMKGTLLSNNGAVTTGNQCSVEGRLFSNNGACGLDGSSVSIPLACSSIFGLLSSFAVFSSFGNVSNLGASNIQGDIGTDAGTITGFEAATVSGTIYPPSVVASSATATFSIYQNGILVPFSGRTRISTMDLGEISLQAIVTIAAGEAIDIRWKIDAGTIQLKNRIVTLLNVR
jgi:hypothetical protein